MLSARLALVPTLFFVVASARAGSLTTLFAHDNNGALGGAVYFDLTVGPNDLTLHGLDVNTSVLSQFGVQLYVRLGTHVGNESAPDGWQAGPQGLGIGAGADNPSPVTFSLAPVFTRNRTYGLAIALRGSAGWADHLYTNGTGMNQSYGNADVSLSLGAASNTVFSGEPFTPRVWNGTLHYTVVPEPGTMAVGGFGFLAFVLRKRRLS